MSNDTAAGSARDATTGEPPPPRLTDLLRSLSRTPSTANTDGEENGGMPSETTATATPGASTFAAIPASRSTALTDAQARRREQRRQAQSRHASMLDGLIRSLDIVAYAQMSIIYYMDNSFARLLLRLFPHWLFFTPKPAVFPAPPRRRPYVLQIVLANATCMLWHLLSAAPSAGEAARWYLHGGFLIDFVGERGPVSKFRLVGADVAVLVLQIVLLAVVKERERLRDVMGGGAEQTGSGTGETGAASSPGEHAQDHDAEEQGIRRDTTLDDEDDDHVRESLDLLHDDQEASSAAGANGGPSSSTRREHHPLDRFYSGQFVVAELYVWDALKAAWKESSA